MSRIALPLAPVLLLALSGSALAAEQSPEMNSAKTELIGHKDGRRGGGSSAAPASRPAGQAAPAAQAPAARPAAPAAAQAPASRPAAPAAQAPVSRPAAPATQAPASRPAAPAAQAPVSRPAAPAAQAPVSRPSAPAAPGAQQTTRPTSPAAAPGKSTSAANPWQVQNGPSNMSGAGRPAAPGSAASRPAGTSGAPVLGAPGRPGPATPSRSSFNTARSAAPGASTSGARPAGGSNAPAHTSQTRPPTHPSDRPDHFNGGSRAETTPAHHAGPHTRPGSAPHARPGYGAPPHGHAAYHPRPYGPGQGWYHAHYRPYYPARPVYWYHGVFVYGPPPVYHQVYVVDGGSSATVAAPAPELPKRQVDRSQSFSLGMRGGSYYTGYDGGGAFSDAGVGLTARYRPVEAVGFELAYTYYNDTFDNDTERATSLVQPSVQVFAAPWSRVSPYVSLGATFARRDYNDTWNNGGVPAHTSVQDGAWGPHAGLGLELALGQSAAIDLEARYVGLLNVGGDDPSSSGALQGTAGLNFYF